jgi:hypothetical protein
MGIFRSNILDLLQLISSKERQDKYQKDVPYVNIADELICMWFDDCYHPDDNQFKNNFDSNELKILDDFSTYFNQRVPKLPKNYYDYWESKGWLEVVGKAKETLEKLGWDSIESE